MAFLDNNKFKEILSASRGGNDKAKIIIQAMMKGGNQEDLDRLVNNYYGLDDMIQMAVEPEAAMECDNCCDQCEEIPSELEPEIIDQPAIPSDIEDLSDVLGKETEGLFEEADFNDVPFKDFLKNKKKDTNKALKNADYFKAFNGDSRNAFADQIIDKYHDKFINNLSDIEKGHNDTDRSISIYVQGVNDELDDDIDFDQSKAGDAYNGFVDNDMAMHSFGRFWDDDDNNIVIGELKRLMGQYGKKNVIAALNILKGDNDSHRDFLNNQIDQNISKYSKSVDKLLR